MFWFAGLAGMGLESKRLRRWLASHRDARIAHQTVEPPSNISAFNPFPALVMGVTGAAMSAHAQTYLFQVRTLIHGQFPGQTTRNVRLKFTHFGDQHW